MTTHPTITDVEVIGLPEPADNGNDRHFVAVSGGGDTGWYGPISQVMAKQIARTLADAVQGWPVFDHDALQEAARRPVGIHPTKAESWAIGAIDCAVWDLHGRIVGSSVADLVAPSPAWPVPLYASWLRLDLAEPSSQEAVAAVRGDGWRFTKWGLRYRPHGASLQETVDEMAVATQMVASTLGTAAAFDAVFTWNTHLTCEFIARIDRHTVLWLEDPLVPTTGHAYRQLPPFPLALGETLRVGDDADDILALDLRAFTLDVVGCGGLTRAVELIKQAASVGTAVYPHGRSLVPALHLAAAFPSVVAAVEYQLQWEPARQQQYTDPWLPAAGRMAAPDRAGLGTTPRRTHQ